jgi:hypothetical protein
MIDPIEDELDAIRIKLYEKTKDMTTGERVRFLNKSAEDALRRHGIKAKMVSLADNNNTARA